MDHPREHIRDIMSTNKDDLKKGLVTTKTLCGLDDPSMRKLCYIDPGSLKYAKNPCERCSRIWQEEAGSDREQKKAYHSFRKMMHKALRMGYKG